MLQTQPNSISRFDYINFNYKTSKWPVPNQSNGTSMMQPYLPLALTLPDIIDRTHQELASGKPSTAKKCSPAKVSNSFHLFVLGRLDSN